MLETEPDVAPFTEPEPLREVELDDDAGVVLLVEELGVADPLLSVEAPLSDEAVEELDAPLLEVAPVVDPEPKVESVEVDAGVDVLLVLLVDGMELVEALDPLIWADCDDWSDCEIWDEGVLEVLEVVPETPPVPERPNAPEALDVSVEVEAPVPEVAPLAVALLLVEFEVTVFTFELFV